VLVGELREQLKELPDNAQVWVRDTTVRSELFTKWDQPVRCVRRLRTRFLKSKIVTIEFGG